MQWGKQHCKSPGTVEEHKTGEKIKGTGETRKRFRTEKDPRKKRSGKDKETRGQLVRELLPIEVVFLNT